MERLVTNYLDATRFGPDSAPECRFRAVVGIDGVSFIAVHQPTSRLLALKSWVFEPKDLDAALRRILSSELCVDYTYQSQQVLLFNPWVTLVPNRMFLPDQLPVYFKLLTEQQLAAYHYTELPDQTFKLVYALEAQLLRQTELYFASAAKSHQAVALIDAWAQLSSPQDANVWLNLRHHYLQIAVYERQKLVFYNTFPYDKPNDIAYFVLLAYDQHRLKAEDIPLGISGTVVEDSDVYRTLFRFVRNIRFARVDTSFGFPPDVQNHFYLELLSV